MKRLSIIKAGSTFASTAARLGDFEAWIINGLGSLDCPVEVVDAARGGRLPEPGECAGVVVTGSHAMVTDDLPWSLAIERWIPRLVEAGVPFLGICYGHQLLGRAAGGEVGYHPVGREAGTVAVGLTAEAYGDRLFEGLPECFQAHATHAQSVLRLPPGAVRLAGNPHDPNHAFRIGRCAWGVQFHPEYTREVMEAYLPGGAGAGEAPWAGRVLTNFARIACRES
ncbi:MAG: glutamine amidotransferase [Chlorobiaceae bacterium]|nr:glutamine amidotransferase [Chlorobiaceae bacterium]